MTARFSLREFACGIAEIPGEPVAVGVEVADATGNETVAAEPRVEEITATAFD